MIVLCVSCGELAPSVDDTSKRSATTSSASELSRAAIRANPNRFVAQALTNYQSGRLKAAREIVDIVNSEASTQSRLDVDGMFQLNVLRAHLSLDDDRDPGELVRTLTPTSLAQRVAALEVWGRFLTRKERFLEASLTFFRAKEISQTADPSSNNRLTAMLWDLLISVPSPEIATFAKRVDNQNLRLWWELAAQFNNSLSFAGWQTAWRNWSRQNSRHESVSWLPRQLRDEFSRPKHIAILLPQSGNDAYAQAARGIRDGWLLAYMTDAKTNASRDIPTFTFLDTVGANPVQLVRDAFAAGADHVVGPLTKEAVNAVVASSRYDGSILMLNDPDKVQTPRPETMRFLALSIEDEALKIASKLAEENEPKCVLIYGDEGWMIRARSAFELNLKMPARVIAVNRISEFERLTDVIGASLGVEDSTIRHNNIEAMVNFNLEFQPRVNKEINCIVAFIDADQLEAVLESLRYHTARQLDIYVTDSAVRGELPELADGIQFTTSAWQIFDSPFAQQVSEYFEPNANMALFYAMGIDAYRLSNFWSRMSESTTFAGSIGRYRLESTGNITRLPFWGVVENQRLTPFYQTTQQPEERPYL